jgi:hypothetical protein
LVIRYAYLWRREHLEGRDEGSKDRPCAIVLAVANADDGDVAVVVAPITHTPPTDLAPAVEIPPLTKQRLGLDDERSWIVVSEANRFVWPGPDLRPREAGRPETVAYGLLPRGLFEEVKSKLIAAVRAQRGTMIRRST